MYVLRNVCVAKCVCCEIALEMPAVSLLVDKEASSNIGNGKVGGIHGYIDDRRTLYEEERRVSTKDLYAW